MNFIGMKNQTSKYPNGYIKTIGETYQQNHLTLKKLAMVTPEEDTQQLDVTDIAEFRLLQNQEKLLELGASLQASNLVDICDILTFWHKVAIEDMSPEDIRGSDELIMVIHNYFTQQYKG